MTQNEVVATIEGRPRPAVVLQREAERTLVRFRDAGGFREEWVPNSGIVAVEGTTSRPNLLKLVGLAAVGLVGLVLLFYPGGSDKRLADTGPTPSPTPTATPTATPSPGTARPTTAVLFGDSFVAGRGLAKGQHTAVQVAAKLLGWDAKVLGGDGTAFTTGGTRGGSPYAIRIVREITTAPDILLLQGGASDTGASPAQLSAAAGSVLDGLARRFPTTRVVLLGPVAMEQPADAALVRVDGTLRAVATAHRISYIDPIALRWITPANFARLIASTGFYPNAAGHAYLGKKLADALRAA